MRSSLSGIGNRHTGWRAGLGLAAVAAGLLALAPVARAQEGEGTNGAPAAQMSNPAGNQTSREQEAPPFPVVRLSDVEGKVQIRRGDQTEFSQAVMNLPLTQGSEIETGADGRAEIEFEDGSVARITPNGSLTIRRLQATSKGTIENTVEQSSGLIYYELRGDASTPFQVIFGGGTITPLADSTFRVDLEATPQTVAVMDGRVQVTGPASSYQVAVQQGKMIQFQNTGNVKYTVVDGILPNGFDDWNDQLDQQAAQEAENQTPARVQQGGGSIMDSGIGWSDLDNAGGWYPLPGYGMVWQPYGAGPGFDPYGFGTWVGFGGGYSWVSGYPWGWLPFNCGSWSYIGSFGWGWMPGPYGCGYGVGFGYYGGYGYGRRWHNRRCPHTNIHGTPRGYHSPAPPRLVKGQRAPRMVPVGSRPASMPGGLRSLRTEDRHGHGGVRAISYHGEKIAPLHSMMRGVRVPARNAALVNNYPAHAFPGGVRGAMLNHSGAGGGAEAHSGLSSAMRRSESIGHARSFRGTEVANRGEGFHEFAGRNHGEAFNVARENSLASHRVGSMNRAAFGQRASFGQHTSFGPRGGFSGARSSFAGRGGFHSGGAIRSGGGFHAGGAGHAGGFSGGGFHGGGSVSAGGGGHAGGSVGGGGAHR